MRSTVETYSTTLRFLWWCPRWSTRIVIDMDERNDDIRTNKASTVWLDLYVVPSIWSFASGSAPCSREVCLEYRSAIGHTSFAYAHALTLHEYAETPVKAMFVLPTLYGVGSLEKRMSCMSLSSNPYVSVLSAGIPLYMRKI